jgi:transcription initiation factor TFIIIB Brf1 subunit/transcription initiation factor TFIIB
MATHELVKIDSLEVCSAQNPLERCDVCGSCDIAETREGYTCRDCGIVLEVQKLEYHRPYDAEIVQYAVLGKTQMGYRHERRATKNSVRLEGLNRLDSHRTSEENVLISAKIAIKSILTNLDFPLGDSVSVLEIFKKIRVQLGKGTKYRSAEMLVPCVIYFYYKHNNTPISEKRLIEVSKISKKDFNEFKITMVKLWPQYKDRDRKEYIIQRILEITEHFDLGMPFYYQSFKILSRFYESVKNTKDDVIVGLITSITLLCSQPEGVSVSAICERLGIKMSTIHRQVERRVIERFKVPGFKSLVKSASLLKKVMAKLGVLEPAFIDVEGESVDYEDSLVDGADIVQVVLGNATQVFNNLNESKDFYLFLKNINGYLFATIIQNHNSYNNSDKRFVNYNQKKTKSAGKVENKEIIKLELWKYYNPKGPPLTC